MNKKLVMWGTFLVVFLVSIVGSYKFINKDNQNMTIELSVPTLPLVSMTAGENAYNTLYGYTETMEVVDVAKYVWNVADDRSIAGQIETFGEKIKRASYEVRNNNAERLIEAGELSLEEVNGNILRFAIKMKDLIEVGEEYIFTIILDTENHQEVRYYTRFVYGNTYDIENQLAFVREFHQNTLAKDKASEISQYMETKSGSDNSTLAYVDIYSSTKQVMWDTLPIELVTEPDVYITYLQDNYGAYTLDYYVSSHVDGMLQYYHVIEDYLISTYRDKIYLLDYERTADTVFQSHNDVYNNNKINLGIQSEEIKVAESDDGNMAAFIINHTLYYYDDVENQINYVFSFFDENNKDKRSVHFDYDIKVLRIDEAGSMCFIVYGYMNRGDYEGKTGVLIYAYDGQNKLIEEIGFLESNRSAEYVMQEVDSLFYLGRNDCFYFKVDGNIVSYDPNQRKTQVKIPFDNIEEMYLSQNQSCLAVKYGEEVSIWNLENGFMTQMQAQEHKGIVPLGFIGDDFVYGICYEEDSILQSDGTYSQYMREVIIQNTQGQQLKTYHAEGMLICDAKVFGNQILLDRVIINGGRVIPASSDQIVSSQKVDLGMNYIQSAVTQNYQTIQQMSLKNKIDISGLGFVQAKEVFFEGNREILLELDGKQKYHGVYTPWKIETYVTDAGQAVVLADELQGYARDEQGAIIWKKQTSSTKNQIMAIELEPATAQRSSKNICLDIMLREIGNPKETAEELAQGKTCQEILSTVQGDSIWIDVTGSSLESLIYYIDQDIPVMVLYDTGEAVLITGFNQFNVVIMDPVQKKLGYMSRSDASEMLATTNNQVFTYYKKKIN